MTQSSSKPQAMLSSVGSQVQVPDESGVNLLRSESADLCPLTSAMPYYQAHLDRVSRSFAFCIARLKAPLRERVALAYLLCRVLDTVEDANHPTKALQKESFAEFNRFLSQPTSEAKIAAWAGKIQTGVSEAERQLLTSAPRLFSDLHSLPKSIREIFQKLIGSMSHGMEYFSGKEQIGLRLKNTTEVNEYCFFVAGIVGEILTELFLLQMEAKTSEAFQQIWVNGAHFGLFLQKVNLLKDQMADVAVQRFLLPDRDAVQNSLKGHSQRAIEYIHSIPISVAEYRLFCAWSLFLGLASLPHIDRAWREKRPRKISRLETLKVLAQVEAVILDRARLAALYESYIERTEFCPVDIAKPHGMSYAATLYSGRLNKKELDELINDGC